MARRLLTLIALAVVASSCSSVGAYEDLTPAEAQFVIPDSERWAPGDSCADSGCEGPVTIEQLRSLSWVDVGGLEARGGDGATLTPIRWIRGAEGSALFEVEMPAEDARLVTDVLAEGLRVWAGVDETGRVAQVLTIDESGRFAAVGRGRAASTTVPLAGLVAVSRRESAEEFLADVLSR
ncbi:MAG: hypothetical protein ACR2P0_00850 [Acidimicrobiales bacterium]